MNISVKKFSKKSLSLLIALIMVVSSITLSTPMIVQAAWGLSFKEGIKVSGYTNNPAGMYYGGGSYGGEYKDYALYVIENVDGNKAVIADDGTFIVQKGSSLTLRQNFGTWADNPNTSAGGTGVANNGLHWYYGTSNSYTLRLGYGNDTPYCNAYIDSGSTPQQTSIRGTIENGTKNPSVKFYAGAGNYGSNHDAYIDYGFSSTNSSYFLNKVGTYTLNLFTPLAFTKDNDINKTGSYYNSNPSGNKVNVKIKVVDSFTVTFKKKNGDVIQERKITVGNSIGAFPSNSPVEPNSVSTMGDVHYTYSWPTTYNANSVITSDITIQEVETGASCSGGTATCQKKAVCSVCGVEYGSYGDHTYNTTVRQEPGPVINGFTYTKCDNCDKRKDGTFSYDDVSSNWTNYNNQLKVCETELSNTAKYTADSIASVRSEVDSIKTTVEGNSGGEYETLSSTFIDRQTDSLMTALTKLEIAKYKVTLRFKDENGVSLKIPGSTANYQDSEEISYGNMTLAKIPKAFEDNGYSVIKWARIGENTDTIHGLNSSSLNVVVKKNMEYAVYLKKTTVDDNQASGNAVITLNNKSNKVVDIGYVAMKQDGTETQAKVSVNTDAGTITIGNTTLTAPKYSFYNLIGFEIGGIRVASGQTITLNSKMVIRPVYKAKQTVRITRATGSNFLINEQDVPSIDVDWNKKIVMTYKGEVPDGQVVIWKDGNGNLLAQGSTYSFYANSNVTISATVEAYAPKDPTASIGLFSYDPTDNKVTVVNNFYVPDGMTATKAGVILSTKNSTREALIAQTNGKFEGDESQFTTDKNQIRISVSRTATTSFTMYALAYVVVEDANGKTNTYYAPTVRSITYPIGTTA